MVGSGAQNFTVLATFLMQTLERMAKRLEAFYSKLARLKVYQPELERNPSKSSLEPRADQGPRRLLFHPNAADDPGCRTGLCAGTEPQD
jgi:hypothetical protein